MDVVCRDPASEFSRTFEACYGRVHAYAARRLGSDAADDVAAETFMVAWRRIDAMPAEPLPWLYGVARNIVLRQRAACARQQAVGQALAAEPPRTDATDGDDPAVWDAWQRLSATDQEVLALVAWEELSVRDAARSLGCSAPVFSVRLHRARRRFERLLESRTGQSATIPRLTEAA
jgi:RNA polymerase sigma-70 factor (ECF subfamily)